ncbi:cytosol aminopeptidase family, catalytic domain-containing protein [Pisolithus croceorrhizus]|nr:cytosol aminopeptidase family, catalytic domain-containing protein [Pisolithus croceorrhizus]KAI6122433.1 cytosol aminopeptidase family, catalytic domain-containing protein [Pisolithus croceorrhizus]KAI6161283.1 cytosol aminopeptidase family, catalytic domain-containing protein [Pisolithus thermaeus]
MSAKAYIIPIDPQNPTSSVVPPVDPAVLWSKVPPSQKPAKVGSSHLFYGVPGNNVTALISLGEAFPTKKGNARRELVRKAIGSGVKSVRTLGEGVSEAIVDISLDPHAAAVAAHLALYDFTLKTSPPSPFDPRPTEPAREKLNLTASAASAEWDRGVIYARAQNLARTLMELPANFMTPTAFTERVKSEFEGLDNVKVVVHDEAWAAEKGMRTFLSVTKGTDEPAKFLEIHYRGAPSPNARPLAFVGKGITFDSGGISLKPSSGMKLMRGDMGGAAAVVSSILAIAQLRLPINVVGVTPLCENMPGPSANKPGDIIYAMNGKSVEVDNTDAEGRLILADALYYASTEFKPHTLIDVATLTGAMDVALGEAYSGIFTMSDELWEQLHAAGEAEYDRFWRMPLDEDYGPQIYSSNADLCNTGGKPAGACTAALFLKSFVDGIEPKDGSEPRVQWAHVDIAGTMEFTRPIPYQGKGMTGRPVRALVEYARRLSADQA